MKRWHVAQAVRNREIAASLSVVAYGLEAYVPVIQRQRKIGRKLLEVSAPRFGTYIFVRFDAWEDPWPRLVSEHIDRRKYFERVLCSAGGMPLPVPDEAMEAIRNYQPPKQEEAEPYVYTPGERVTCYIAGVRKEAVFLKYQGNRRFVRTWLFGTEHVAEVREAELEPLDLDDGNRFAIKAS